VAGGQCIALYADKPIYDIPGTKVCSGRELVARLLDQVAPFKPALHLRQLVDSVAAQADGRYRVQSSNGQIFITRSIFIAAGVGAFQARKLHLAGLDAFEGTQVHYQVPALADTQGKSVVIVGGEQAALEAAADACDGLARSVTLVHRRDVLHADAATLARITTHRSSGRLRFIAGQAQSFKGKARLHTLGILDADEQEIAVKLDQLWVFLGVSPKLGPIAQWDLDMERKQLLVDTATFATSAPGIFAVGDINHYPGKKKLIVCGFHEATLAAFGAMPYIRPGQAVALQYTTTSTQLHKALGVA
jgi:thioredoxin reductase (NADPH)